MPIAQPKETVLTPKVERFGLESVPAELRQTTWLEYFFIQVSFSVNAGNFLVPAMAVLEGKLSFPMAVLSTVFGAALAFLFVSALSLPGSKIGIPAQFALRAMLGTKAARFLASPIRTLTSLYWFAVQTIGGSLVIKELFEHNFSLSIPFIPLALAMSLLMTLLAVMGFETVKRVTRYFVPILLFGQVVIFYLYITKEYNGTAFSDVLSAPGSNSLSAFLLFSSLSFVQYISGVSSSSDMTRYAKTPAHGFFGIFIGNTTGFILTALLGAYTAALSQTWNPFTAAIKLTDSGFIIFIIMLCSMISMISINLNNAYTGGYSLLNSLPGLGRVRSAVLFSCFASVLSLFPDLVQEAKFYISGLGAFIIPLSAVIAADFIIVKKLTFSESDLEKLQGNQFHYNGRGLLAIAIGFVMYILLPEQLSPGFLSFTLTASLYALLSKKQAIRHLSGQREVNY